MNSTPPGAAVDVARLGLKGPRGWAFRDIDAAAEPGTLIAVEGPSGSGRTSLLLVLTGRMRPSTGHAATGRLPLTGGRRSGQERRMAAVRRISALAHVPGVCELDPALTVAEHLREHALLQRRFAGSLRALLRPRRERAAEARRRIDAALDAAGLDPAALPKQERTAVRDLERLESLRLSIALALIDAPRLLAVDDTDLKLSDTEREQAWDLLRTVAASGTTVLAVCSQAPPDALVIRTARDRRPDSADGPRSGSGTGKDNGPAPEPAGTGSASGTGDSTDDDTPAEAAPAAASGTEDHDNEGTKDAFAETGRS
ncbi:ATP-binding cassette domain-containing protein [Streptomyces meridianus]|uniref:ATP-binding cassette domain-containing protein n=1 Tax=Streptomyces meridianus TaxID=2938945 RepID=A0ABT0X1N8_9ACTN|nr:ATP-binding cassette domain-containing protein [Streptomyces meridianus]MCM2576443.1 ATP-binding cassette domain-containing protein [Streptomyces meridianus]